MDTAWCVPLQTLAKQGVARTQRRHVDLHNYSKKLNPSQQIFVHQKEAAAKLYCMVEIFHTLSQVDSADNKFPKK